jgi:putative zinc finger/helix-turn-helix YgiT family protein
MKKAKGDYRYTESGLDNILLTGVTIYKCACGEVMPELKDVERIHRTIADVLVKKNTRLSGKEVRFLRKETGMSSKELAGLLSVSPVTVSRWESGKEKVGSVSDKLIRMLYVQMMQERSHKVCVGVVSDIKSIKPKESRMSLKIDLSHDIGYLTPA